MCIWPIGLVQCGQPTCRRGASLRRCSSHPRRGGRLLSGCAAAVAAAVAAGLRPGTTAGVACREALSAIHPVSGAPMQRSHRRGCVPCRRRVRLRGVPRSVSRAVPTEPRPATRARPYRLRSHLPCWPVGGCPEAVEYAANFGRDTDTIATMTGALCGAVSARCASRRVGRADWVIPPSPRPVTIAEGLARARQGAGGGEDPTGPGPCPACCPATFALQRAEADSASPTDPLLEPLDRLPEGLLEVCEVVGPPVMVGHAIRPATADCARGCSGPLREGARAGPSPAPGRTSPTVRRPPT